MTPKSPSDQFRSSVVSGTQKVKELKEVLDGKKEKQEPAATKANEEGSMQQPVDRQTEKREKDLQDEVEKLEKMVAEREEAVVALNEKYLRGMADFDNARKRMKREHDEMVRYGNEKLIKELLTAIDHLEMTLSHASQPTNGGNGQEKNSQTDPLLEGIQLTLREFLTTLEKFGVQVITGEGKPFNPHLQESIEKITTRDLPPGSVVTVHRKGYLLFDRVIRAALVAVAASPEEE